MPTYDANGQLTDQALVVKAMLCDAMASHTTEYDEEARELFAEVERRFGAGSTDLTADWVTGCHMTGDEAVLWAATDWDHCQRVLRGEMHEED